MTRESGKLKSGNILIPFLFFSGFLLTALIANVVSLMPTKTPFQERYWITMHQSLRNYIIAKKMIVELLPSTPTRWSNPIQCSLMGNGVWYAEGVAGTLSPQGKEMGTPWVAIFIPETSRTLYLSAGAQVRGNYAAALRQAGLDSGHP